METPKKVENDLNSGGKNPTTFKKPILIGKIGFLPRKMTSLKADESKGREMVENTLTEIVADPEPVSKPIKSPAEQFSENTQELQYKEPSWSGLPEQKGKEYTMEVLKSGVIVEQINLMKKAFWVIGRSVNCDIYMAHPTISRYHAVLQYRLTGTDKDPPGFYIYDLNSTHGTLLNKGRLKSKIYAPLKVGHMLKLGFSTRSYVLSGPDEDKEEESTLSLTKLKQQRAEKLLKQQFDMKEAIIKEELEKKERQKRYEERGVDWGLGDDADEATDIIENPFAQSNNEDLYIDDPKKALRGFMEREGYNLDYDCTEQGFGQFLCKVELPLDDDNGHRVIAEVLHKGKKKEAVVQCALEACRILDRYGVLRQATHESRKRKARNWEENDYYDSDDDTFLDRTGTVEKKRQKRMNTKITQQPETYQSLLEKEKTIHEQIVQIEKQLSVVKEQNAKLEASDEDSLDLFMKCLNESKLDRQTISKLKSDLAMLKNEHISIVKLLNLVKPADLPPLVPEYTQNTDHVASSVVKSKLPIFGKRKKIKIDMPQSSSTDLDKQSKNNEDKDRVEELQLGSDCNSKADASETPEKEIDFKQNGQGFEVSVYVKIYKKVTEFQQILQVESFPSSVSNLIVQITDVLSDIKMIAEQNGNIETGKNLITIKNQEVKKHVDSLLESYDHVLKVSKELSSLVVENYSSAEIQGGVLSKLRVLASNVNLISKKVYDQTNAFKKGNSKKVLDETRHFESDRLQNSDQEEADGGKQLSAEELDKRKRKNQKRNQHRKEKNEIEKQRGYKEDAQKEDYNMWIPPKNQTGDGRTKLNDKYGY